MIRCLVYRTGFAGDILMSTASLRGIKQKNSEVHLTYGLWGRYAEIVSLNPNVDELVIPGYYRVSDYDLWVDFRHEDLMDDYPKTYWGHLHAMQCAEKGLLDLDKMESFKPEFYIGPDDCAEKRSGKVCVVNGWSQNGIGWRLWSAENWAKLVGEISKMGYTMVQLGEKGDPSIPHNIDLRGKTRLAQVAGVVAIADLAICIDSFVAHVAHSSIYVHDVEADTIEKIADSTPTVLLAGPISPSCVVPTDAKCVPVSVYPDCKGPCGISHPGTAAGRICKYENSCMRSLPVEKVVEGVERCLSLN